MTTAEGEARSNRASAGQLRAWRAAALAQTESCPVEAAEVDWLLQVLAQVDKLALRLAEDGAMLSLGCSFQQLQALWQQRLETGVPLQYLVGQVPWRDFLLRVGPGVLIPRPETELLIDLVSEQISRQPAHPQRGLRQGIWVDLGTGSGAIALGLATLLPAATIHAVDCSPEALAIAQQNIQNYAPDRIQLYQGEWLAPLGQFQGQLQGMVSNPPYIPTDQLADLQPEVRDHEPSLALDGGPDGLDSLRHLVDEGAKYLTSGGFWAVELMAGQAPVVEALLQAHGSYGQTGRGLDLAGIERFVWAYRL